ncbi:hypothetical protein CPLU01_12754 [Colletotrichum plurivorum]|uniref:Uncharacterized protein n=1 Tax=Colletotrichum plurivorum TaxID=2175906 RepID=A0A8H6N5M6_9PEZI|nr:hypothetical protein CPLU01_12754 [Colletotrichum plurivorum]
MGAGCSCATFAFEIPKFEKKGASLRLQHPCIRRNDRWPACLRFKTCLVTLSVFPRFFQVTFGMTKVFDARGPGYGTHAICPERHVTDTCGTCTDDGSVNYATTESSRPPKKGGLTTKKAMFAAALRDIFCLYISWHSTMWIIIFHSYRVDPWDWTLP